MQDSFEETQKVVLSTVLKDSYILAKVKDDIRISYFTKISHRVIYKGILYFYSHYGKLPSELELTLAIKDMKPDEICSMEEIQQDLRELYDLPVSSLEFTTDQVSRFVKRKRLENTLKEFIPRIQEGDSLCIDEMGKRLSESVVLNLHNSKAFQISNTVQLEDVRRDSIGSDTNPTIIQSVIPNVNNSLLYRGYKSGDIVIVVARPGCFTGDTEVVLGDESTATLEQLYESGMGFEIRGYDFEKRRYRNGKCLGAVLTGYVSELLAITFQNGKTVRCTKDHQFLLADRDVYVRATDLQMFERVRSNNSAGHAIITHIELVRLDHPVPVYDIYQSGVYSNYLVHLENGIGVSVHNCGKTMFMTNELANAARQGYNALHLFIGDMTEYDGLVRYLSNISGTPQDDLASMPLEEQRGLIESINSESDILSRITVKAYAASEITVDQMIEDVFKIQNDMHVHYDIIAVDYPDNLIKSQESMYESGGDIYNRLSYLARRNKCVILAGSQPKISNWNDEIIPLSGCAESSKKQHIADLIIALGRPSNDSKLLTGFLAKVRRGTMGTIFRARTEFERARLQMISEFDYIGEKSQEADRMKNSDKPKKTA